MALTKVTRGGITADAVDGTKIADDAVDSEHLAADSIDAEHYAAGSVDTTALGADAVTAAKIGDDVIDSEHYAATSVDNAHINDVAASKLTGTIATARLGSGTASSSTILYGDQTYKTEPAGFDPDAAVVFNESGADYDFRIESDDNVNMFFVDGGNDRIGIGTASPAVQVELNHATEPRLRLRNTVTPDGTKVGGILDLELGSRGGGGSGNDDTEAGDVLGVINFGGQGTNYAYQGAGIQAVVEVGDGTATREEQGVGLVFSTMAAPTANGYSEKFRITNDGRGLSQFTAKAWINLNGTGTIAIRDSHNVSSITDNGTGDYTVTFDNDFSYNGANIITAAKGSGDAGSNSINMTGLATSYRRFTTGRDDSTRTNPDYISCLFFGD